MRKKYAKLCFFMMTTMAPFLAQAAGETIDMKKGFAYIRYILLALGMLSAAVLGFKGSAQFSDDPSKAKMTLTGAISMAIFSAVIFFIFNKLFGIDTSVTDSL